ncbi:uncharacterized protein LOC124455094 [Xenia sp. Carnegie-2017]|uniref:uncharacterized protein LOC124455094 n=1 Tax=Xenia sp. Carnegie-2017 TaxID=2897299 RepID=UPI001F04BB21|nr:uncharacterized protein LOC124455094 [Xenia sp. Carnegie-2017]
MEPYADGSKPLSFQTDKDENPNRIQSQATASTSSNPNIVYHDLDKDVEWHSQKWEYLGHSVEHKSLLLELCGRNPGADIKYVGNVRVIFSKKFMLGEGNNETRVYLGLTNDGYGKAVKQIRRDNYFQPAQHEKKILNEFNAKKSKYVVNYYFLEEDTGTEYVYLILDLCEESLEKFVKKCNTTIHDLQKALPDILRNILNGLNDLHSGSNPIIHRDLKPCNVLRDVDGKFLIADFGISRMLKNGSTTYKSKFNRGTEYWIAPESYRDDEDSNEARNEDLNKARYKKESDVYNAGMVAYYVATKGKHPFGTKRLRLDNMLNGKPVGLDEIKDETLKDLLSWMLKLQPEERPSAKEALKHPFLLSDDDIFHFLCKVGDLLSIRRNYPHSSLVQQINIESSNWKSQMDNDVYEYLVNGRKYGSSWTECLRLIQDIGQHRNDGPRPLPQPEPFYKIGDYRTYFVETFPSLPVRIHAALRSNNELKEHVEANTVTDGNVEASTVTGGNVEASKGTRGNAKASTRTGGNVEARTGTDGNVEASTGSNKKSLVKTKYVDGICRGQELFEKQKIGYMYQKADYHQENSNNSSIKKRNSESMMTVVFNAMLSKNFQKDYNEETKIFIRGEEPIFKGWNDEHGESVIVERDDQDQLILRCEVNVPLNLCHHMCAYKYVLVGDKKKAEDVKYECLVEVQSRNRGYNYINRCLIIPPEFQSENKIYYKFDGFVYKNSERNIPNSLLSSDRELFFLRFFPYWNGFSATSDTIKLPDEALEILHYLYLAVIEMWTLNDGTFMKTDFPMPAFKKIFREIFMPKIEKNLNVMRTNEEEKKVDALISSAIIASVFGEYNVPLDRPDGIKLLQCLKLPVNKTICTRFMATLNKFDPKVLRFVLMQSRLNMRLKICI